MSSEARLHRSETGSRSLPAASARNRAASARAPPCQYARRAGLHILSRFLSPLRERFPFKPEDRNPAGVPPCFVNVAMLGQEYDYGLDPEFAKAGKRQCGQIRVDRSLGGSQKK